MKNKIKKIGSFLLVFIIVIALLEFISPWLYQFKTKSPYDRAKIIERLNTVTSANDSISNSTQEKGITQYYVLHPYLGYVEGHGTHSYTNEHGLLGNIALPSKKENTINVCLLGGSVGQILFELSSKTLQAELEKKWNKKVDIYCLALGGYKQPQHLLALNYYLFLGAQFDVVINIDGFNEVVLSGVDNYAHGVYPYFPRLWSEFSQKSLSLGQTKAYSDLFLARKSQLNLAQKFNHFPFNKSNFCLILWGSLDAKKGREINGLYQTLKNQLQTNNFQSTGPKITYPNKQVFYQDQAARWKQASMQIQALANQFHFQYYHFLQPNQYVENSKEFSDEEKNLFSLDKPHIYRTSVKEGYPYLQKEGAELVKKNIHFIDLTPVFKSYKESIYSDDCCHYNQSGNDIIARKMVESVDK